MTATIRPPERDSASARRLRFSSLESLGFSDDMSTWSDSPLPPAGPHRGRHEAGTVEPDTVADWKPEEFGDRLTGGNVRWALVGLIFSLIAGLVGFGYWLYQRPLAQHEAAVAAVESQAEALDDSLPTLEALNEGLLAQRPVVDPKALSALERDARALFEASGQLARSDTQMRRASSEAAGAVLDGVRLVNEATSYRAAVTPILSTPELEVDPEVIGLDEAARSFGHWQLSFNEVRSALPDDVLSRVTQQLDVMSGDLGGILARYIDALREDDMAAAESVVADLGSRLGAIEDAMVAAIADIQARVTTRIEETRSELSRILAD